MYKKINFKRNLVAVFLALLLATNLALLVVLTGCEKPKSNNYDDEARQINEAVNLASDEPTRPTTRQFDESGSNIDIENIVGVVENYVELDELFALNIPEQLASKLDDGVMDYIKARLKDVNDAIQNAENEYDSSNVSDNIVVDVFNKNDFIRGGFSFDTRWLALAIDGALVLANLAIGAARSVAWLFGKKSVVRTMKKFISFAINVMFIFAPSLFAVADKITNIINNASDDLVLRWFSIGGFIANVIDWFDSDGHNGSITFRW